jgi:[protein-PII] uridylyltransferase
MLTINDIRGTNPTLWNSWKHDLLKQLFMSSRRKLNLEEAQSNQSIVDERKVASANVVKQGHDLLNEVWDQLPDAYFSKYQLAQLSNQAKTVAASKSKTAVFVNTRKNLIEIFIFTPNQAGLFLKTVRSFEQLSLETIDSDIYTTKDGKYAMNTFICKHKILGGNLIQRDIQNIEQKIVNAISSENSKATGKSKAAHKKVFEHPTRVHISPSKKRDASLITIETLDQPNLLSKVANIFLDHDISIDSARITTLGEKVEDNFTVIDEKTKLCISQNKTNQLQKKLKNL